MCRLLGQFQVAANSSRYLSRVPACVPALYSVYGRTGSDFLTHRSAVAHVRHGVRGEGRGYDIGVGLLIGAAAKHAVAKGEMDVGGWMVGVRYVGNEKQTSLFLPARTLKLQKELHEEQKIPQSTKGEQLRVPPLACRRRCP